MPVAVVTGGNSGIGRATAVALAQRGFDVGITWHAHEDRANEALRADGSPESSYVTGASYVVDGGMLVMAAMANQLAS